MKLIQNFHNLKNQYLTTILNNETIANSLVTIGLISLASEAIWLLGPHLTFGEHAPLAQPEKRIYLILFLFLSWLLKYLLVDFDKAQQPKRKIPKNRNIHKELQQRFHGAVQFLNKTIITRNGKPTRLKQLPWYLLLGPSNAGKTSLLANSNVQFILQRQFQNKELSEISPSETCDWWVTRDTSIIDVPGKYLTNSSKANGFYRNLWHTFLTLIKKQRGNDGISGIILALPVSDMIKQHDPKSFQIMLHHLFKRLQDIQQYFPNNIPCQLVLTKCDLLPGFSDFFAESTNEEISQAWGITLPEPKEGEKVIDLFAARFNALIKKINQQLLWRLHQERNPMVRPYIKDFPLQVERVKEALFEFIKLLSAANLTISLQGVYLTSAIQPKPEIEGTILDQPSNTSARGLQIFKEPTQASRAYFIKQFLTQGLGYTPIEDVSIATLPQWKRQSAYAASAAAILITAILLGYDFTQSIKQTRAIQHNLSDYQIRITQIQDPDQHFIDTLRLLNTLQQTIKEHEFNIDFTHLFSFYSKKSHEKALDVYQKALNNIFMPEVKNYFENFLQNAVNKNADDIYTAFKAYLQIGDAEQFDPHYIATSLKKILPKTFHESEYASIMNHMQAELNANRNPQALNQNTVDETRRFLNGLPGLRLSYIILKNINSNNKPNEINLGVNADQPIFTSPQVTDQIPAMFTAQSFSTIFSQETTAAALEAAHGNWVLGDNKKTTKNSSQTSLLTNQLRIAYVNNYINAWESLIANIHLFKPADLEQTDAMITSLMSTNSPLLQLLQTLHDNTYFEPIASTSIRLQNLGQLIEKNPTSQASLYQIFNGLQALHLYLQTVISADNPKKAAFETVSKRMLSKGAPDAITQLRFVAAKSPEPIKNWLEKIANDSWIYLMKDAGRYIDTSWQQQVSYIYQADIENHYPFNPTTNTDVDMQKFATFFGNPGIVMSFYNKYLQPFIDTSTPDWHWKKIDGQGFPFSDDTLRQIQTAIRIHHSFFPNGDNKPHVQFALQPYKFGKLVQKVKLSMSNKQYIDENNSSKNSHEIAWPGNNAYKITSIQMTLTDQQIFSRNYAGNWGWHKMLMQSFESMISKKEMLLNLSMNEHPAKYILSTEGQYNPFLSLNLRLFHLPQQLSVESA